jgi:hypothetical protein
MQGWISFFLAPVVALGLAACSPGDDTADGTRGLCAEGGTLNDCPPTDRTARGACWRMVDCGAIPLHRNESFRFDWDNCVATIEAMPEPQQSLVIACIAASTCDQLKDSNRPCFRFGAN